MARAGHLRERVRFGRPVEVEDAAGGVSTSWQDGTTERAAIDYDGGREAEQGGRPTGSAVLRITVRSSAATRAIDATWRMTNLATGRLFNVRDVDSESDPRWVFLRVEGGVAL